MYKPKFNQVLVEIDDKDAAWSPGNDDSFGGESYREGKMLEIGTLLRTQEYECIDLDEELLPSLGKLIGKTIMWNEGHEAGKVFDHDGKKYAFISWYDIIGVKEDD